MRKSNPTPTDLHCLFFLYFCVMMFLSGYQLMAQPNAVDSNNTKTISIPVTCGGFHRWDVKKVHLHKGDVLIANIISENNSGPISSFQDRNNNSLLTSEICYGDSSIGGYFNYLIDLAPCCVILSSHTIGDLETFSYMATNIPGTAYIYFHWSERQNGMSVVHIWLDTCIEVIVD